MQDLELELLHPHLAQPAVLFRSLVKLLSSFYRLVWAWKHEIENFYLAKQS